MHMDTSKQRTTKECQVCRKVLPVALVRTVGSLDICNRCERTLNAGLR